MRSLPAPNVLPLRGGPTLRWGVLAPGVIARAFVSTLHANTDQRVVAVGSRSARRAQSFAADFEIPAAYDAYEYLVADPRVDVVYIAAPHSEHRALALLAIEHGKHVLIEKPIALSEADASDIVRAARRAGVFAMEGMWTRYLPQTTVVAQLLAAGDLGAVKLVAADACWIMDPDPQGRGLNPALGGGALLDAGVYSLWFSHFVLGEPRVIHSVGSLASTGVDAQAAIALGAASGAQAAITTSIVATTAGLATIAGTEATLRYDHSFIYPGGFTVRSGRDQVQFTDASGLNERDGLVWEAAALAAFVAEGRTESPLHSLDDSLAVMRTIDKVKRQLGSS